MSKVHIVGAGLAGLMAACAFKDSLVFERGPQVQQHKALLRFRDESVSTLTGIPFKAVKVRKNIFANGILWGHCDVQVANLYAKKATGAYVGRSIWELDTVTRYVAPEDFYQQLVDRHASRISWNSDFDSRDVAHANAQGNKLISTIPLPQMLDNCGIDTFEPDFEKKAIKVDRYRLPKGTDVYQTLYFPEHHLRVFRASITGDMLIVESVKDADNLAFSYEFSEQEEYDQILKAFGVFEAWIEIEPLGTVDQAYGKIIELPKERRESYLYHLTRDHNVFSLGRFATWRNVLLDDVAKDIKMVERLIAASSYGRDLVLAKR